MTRQELDQKLVDYLFDELSDEEATHFEASVGGHPDLEAEVAAHRTINAAAAQLPEVTMSASVMEEVMAQAAAAVAPVQPRQSWLEALFSSLMQPAMVTAMLFVAVGATSVFVVSQEGPVGTHGAEHAERSAAVAMPEEEEALVVAAVEPATAAAKLGSAAVAEESAPGAGGEAVAVMGRELKALSPTARLVEVDGDDVRLREVAQAEPPRPARAAARTAKEKVAKSSARRASRKIRSKSGPAAAKVLPMQVAKAKQAVAPTAQRMARAPAPVGAAPARLDTRTGYVTRGRTAAPSPFGARDKVKEQAVADEAPVAVQAKRLVSQFDRHLKKGDSPGASRVLDRLANLPGFAETAKRKRVELRKWLKAQGKSKAAKKAKGKSERKAKTKAKK